MSLRRRLERLAKRAERRDRDLDDLDRRSYEGAWRRFDRRAVAPALMGASMLIPFSLETMPARAATRDAGGSEPERASGESALRGASLYVLQGSQARQHLETFDGSARDRVLLEYIASQPTASWFGDWNDDVAHDVDRLMDAAERRGQVPLIVANNIPNRDCGFDSMGGAGSADVYREWVRNLARGIGERRAVVVLEPDALALVSCLTHEGRSERFSLIREAVRVLKGRTDARVYLGAGHAEWVDVDEMAQRLYLAGIDRADGFALNIAAFVSTERNVAYGEQLSRRLGGARFVIDTSRNGGGVRAGEWCNPPGAALGVAPTTETRHPLVDAFLWVKPPGESDGACNGGPEAGEWFGGYALELARAAGVRAVSSAE